MSTKKAEDYQNKVQVPQNTVGNLAQGRRNTALTHTLAIVKHPAGFAVEAFVVLWPGTLPTRVEACCKG